MLQPANKSNRMMTHAGLWCAQAQAMSSTEDLLHRWQVVLTYHGGSPQLWRAHLQWQRAQYGSFAVSHIRTSYQNAIQVSQTRR